MADTLAEQECTPGRAYPEIELDLDFTDRLVDVITSATRASREASAQSSDPLPC